MVVAFGTLFYTTFSISFSFSAPFCLIKVKAIMFFSLICWYIILKVDLLYYLSNSFNAFRFIKVIVKKVKLLYIFLSLIKIIELLGLIK